MTNSRISLPTTAALPSATSFRNLAIFNRLAPNITGMARKKVNSAATLLDTPSSRAPTMVAPEREVPGKMAAIT